MTRSTLSLYQALIQTWFEDNFAQITGIQQKAWFKIANGDKLVVTVPTGSGKTHTAFLWAINPFLLGEYEAEASRVLYISPLEALKRLLSSKEVKIVFTIVALSSLMKFMGHLLTKVTIYPHYRKILSL
ncbi:MAG: Lhr-like helicase [Flavobacterium sp.]|jgi:Lhr-like helicase